MKIANSERKLTIDDQKTLFMLLNEAKARGIGLEKYRKTNISTKNQWNIDDRGYFIRDDGNKYNPNDKQSGFISSKSPFSRFKGGRGSGKTAAGAQKALKKIMQGESGTIINPDFENFKISTWPEFKAWIPWHMVVPQQRYRQVISWEATRPFMMAFINGAKVYCKGLKNPDSARGANVNWLWYDEAQRDVLGLGWKLAVASVRIGKNTQRWATYTAKNESHWTYQFFDLQKIPQEVIDLLRDIGYDMSVPIIDIYHSSSQENKENLDPFFYASLITTYHSGYLRTQEIEGLEASEDTTLGSRLWFEGKGLDEPPDWAFKRIRYWDLAASLPKIKANRTKTDPDSTVGTLLSTDKEKERFCIENQTGGQWIWDTIKENILLTAQKDGPNVPIRIEEEPGSGGKNQVAELVQHLKRHGFTAKGHNPRNEGDKVMRANVWFAEANQGKWYYVKGLWVEPFFQELDSFPIGMHDDDIDSISGARHEIAPIRTWKKTKFLAVGLNQEQIPEEVSTEQ